MNREEQLRLLEEIYGKVEEGKATVTSYSTSIDFMGKTLYTISVMDATAGVSYTTSNSINTAGGIYNVSFPNQVAPLPDKKHFKKDLNEYRLEDLDK